MIRKYKIHLDMKSETKIPDMKFFSTDENNAFIEVYLTNANKHYNLIDHKIVCYVKMPNGKVSTLPISIVNSFGGIVLIKIKQSCLDLLGTHEAQLNISFNGMQHTTQSFSFTVYEGLDGGDSPEELEARVDELEERTTNIESEIFKMYSNDKIDNLLDNLRDELSVETANNYINNKLFSETVVLKADVDDVYSKEEIDEQLNEIRDIYASDIELAEGLAKLEATVDIKLSEVSTGVENLYQYTNQNFVAIHEILLDMSKKIDSMYVPELSDEEIEDMIGSIEW